MRDATLTARPVMVSGEREVPAGWQQGSPGGRLLRLRLLELSVSESLALARVLRGGGLAVRQASAASGTDLLASGEELQLYTSLTRLQSAHRKLAAAGLDALAHFGQRPGPWRCGEYSLPADARPLVMGVLNLDPDSFSGDGRHSTTEAAVEAATRMVEDGADILDVGGESTRPGAEPLGAAEELRRVLPVLEALAGRVPVPLSIDTYRSEVAGAAMDRGVSIINDVTAGEDPAMLALAARHRAGLVLMHMRGTPHSMQQLTQYDDLLREVFLFLHGRAQAAVRAGVPVEGIAVDPGIGFAKTDEHNLALLQRTAELTSLGLPVLVGPSRKGFLGRILDLPAGERAEGTAAACTAAVLGGAAIVRVHDVKVVRRAVQVAAAIGRSRTYAAEGN